MSCFSIGISAVTHAQLFQKNHITKQVVLGFHTSGSGYAYFDPITSDKLYYRYMQFEPYLGYFFNKNFGFGFISNFTTIRSNIDVNDNLNELGLFSRIYFPFKLTPKVLNRLLFSSEISYRRANYSQLSLKEYSKNTNWSSSIITVIPVSIQFKIWKGFHAELSPEWVWHSTKYSKLMYRIGIEYHFSKKKAD